MPGTFTGGYGNTTGSGSSVTLTLTGDVNPTDLLLVLLCWEPRHLSGTFMGTNGLEFRAVQGQIVQADGTLWNATGSSWGIIEVGFAETQWLPGGAGGFTRNFGAAPTVTGRPCYPASTVTTPAGFVARFGAYWQPDPYNEIRADFEARDPTAAYSVPWCLIKTWRIAGFGQEPIAGIVGVSRCEPSTDAGGAGIPHYVATKNDEDYQDINPPFGMLTSDGGDTQDYGDATLTAHHLELGLAGRWGQGTGTFNWDNWTSPTLIDTVNRSQTHGAYFADAHIEVYYKLLATASTATVSGYGTFGAQNTPQNAPGDSFRRGSSGGMLRGTAISAVIGAPGALWMPQIYRRNTVQGVST